MNEFSLHPLSVVVDMVARLGGGYKLSFSKYLYRPQSPLDERETFSVGANEVNADWLDGQISNLREGWELALNSEVVDFRNRRFHIPMIDFYGKDCEFFFTPYFKSILGSKFYESMVVFDSGRSFHAYSPLLLKKKEWVGFMGSLLLLTLPGEGQVVDDRWVGHRLRGGYSALRWSCNTGRYLKMPEQISLKQLFTNCSSPNKGA